MAITTVKSGETWAAGDLYESYVGRWSRAVAQAFLPWLDVPASSRWLDVGCGTGALTETILAHSHPAAVVGVDLSPDFIAYARAHVASPLATFEVGNAQILALQGPRFDAAVSALVLNFLPEPGLAVRAMAGRVHPGGRVAAYVWDYRGQMELMRYFWDAAIALDPAAGALDEGLRFPLCQPDPLQALFADAGLVDVDVRALDVPTVFRDFDDYWSPFLAGNFPAPAYAMSLGGEARSALRARLRSTLPAAADGSIALVARAWAVRGTVHSTTT
jgi:SAM-dependent methyltransferase